MPATNEKQGSVPRIILSAQTWLNEGLWEPSIILEIPQLFKWNHHQQMIKQEVQQEVILKLIRDSLWEPSQKFIPLTWIVWHSS